MKAPINRILPQSCVDGDGNRGVVFFQGCNYNCTYCHNPETINMCTSCGKCVGLCPTGALEFSEGSVAWDSALCTGCDRCIRGCTHSASPKVREMTPAEVMAELGGSLPFIRGITVSGGECSLRRDFLIELFTLAKAAGLSTLMDSNGSFDFSADPALLSLCDGVMLDIKCFDSTEHHKLTGHKSETALKSAVFLAKLGKLPEIRTVVVPGLLPNKQTVDETSRLLAPLLSGTKITYKLIRFRPVGVRARYKKLEQPSDELMERLANIARGNGFTDITIV